MNELIKDLAMQTDIWCDQNITQLSPMFNAQWEQKFAELIVAECTEVCESMPLLGSYKEVQDATLKDAAVQIKQHFGVEE